MGLIRFLVHPAERLSDEAAGRVFLSGPDQIPWKCSTRYHAGELVIERAIDDSGNLNVPWKVEGQGELTLSTGTLMERERPYRLVVELARGTIHQVKSQMAEWRELGLAVPDNIVERLRTSIDRFSRAATGQHDPESAAKYAEEAITAALDTADQLLRCYTDQALVVRHQQTKVLDTLLGANLDQVPVETAFSARLKKASNAAIVPLAWNQIEAREGRYDWDLGDAQIEACKESGLHVCAGPLVRFDSISLPDWLCLWEGDFQNLVSVVSDYVETVVARYRQGVRLWQCVGRLSAKGVLSLSEEEKLQLAVSAVEVVQRGDPEKPTIVSFDQPWGESLASQEMDLPPLHLADALARCGLRLDGIGLELNVGYWPGGTYVRSPLEFSRMIDLWSCLGLPLYVMLCTPSNSGDDALAGSEATTLAASSGDGWSPATQRDWAARMIPLLLAKPTVRGVYWNQLSDAHPHDFPHGGLLDRNAKSKPTLETLAKLRKKHLR